ncbi:MAG: hypothetical protein U1E35_06545 [Rhodospirillales bacterium]
MMPPGGRSPAGKGELVCTRAAPSMPLRFWNDPDASRLRAAYFERFPSGVTATTPRSPATAGS